MFNVNSKYKNFQIDINKFKVIRKINSSSFGDVFMCQDRNTKEQFIAKVLKKQKDDNEYKSMVNTEISIMIHYRFPTIINIIGFSMVDFEGNPNVVIIMDYAAKGSLNDLLQKEIQSLAEIDYDNLARQKILIGIARGMMHLHQHHIIHRDLKPSNILLDNNYNPYITDFDFAQFIAKDEQINTSQQYGTLIYMAPEILLYDKYGLKADVYSFGILMYQVVTGNFPYPELQNESVNERQFRTQIIKNDHRPKFDSGIKTSIQNLIQSCWDPNPDNRPSFEEIYNLLSKSQKNSFYSIFDDENDDKNDEYYLDGVKADDIEEYIEKFDANKIDENRLDGEDKNSSLTNEVENLKNRLQKTQSLKKKIDEKLATQNRQFAIIQEENKKIISVNIGFNTTVEKLNREINSLKLENDELKYQIIGFQNENESLKRKNDFLMKQNSQYQANKNLNARKNDEKETQDSNQDEMQDIQINELTIKDFNSFSLQSQQRIVSKIEMKRSSISKLFFTSLFYSINNLLLYLLDKNGNKKSFHNFEIKSIADDTKLIDINADQCSCNICLKSTNMLGSCLRSEDFINLVKDLNDIWIEVKCPSGSYNSIFNNNILIDFIKVTVIVTDGIETDNLFKDNHQIISVQFDQSICKIGESTFNGCNKLKEVIFDSNEAITSFNSSAFFRCTSLTHITIPSSVTSLLRSAFYECTALRNVSFNRPSKLKLIGDYAFNGCKMLCEILIPSSVEEIGDYAFDRCNSLQHISISFFTKKIGKHSFPESLAVSFT